jgi:hypothetical protein
MLACEGVDFGTSWKMQQDPKPLWDGGRQLFTSNIQKFEQSAVSIAIAPIVTVHRLD